MGKVRVIGVATGAAVGVLIGAAPLDWAAAAVARPSLVTGGYSTNALSLTTVTDTLPGLGALSYAARTGEVVVRTYKLTNRGEATIVGVGVTDPDAGGPVGCGSGGRGSLQVAAWSSATCTVRFAAVAGTHRPHVVASGAIDGVGAPVSASAEAGYFAATPGLTLRELLGPREGTHREATTVPIGAALRVTYTLSNDGDVPLVTVTVSDGQQVSGLTCGAGASKISVLPPGTSKVCTAVLHAAAGLHSGSATAVGTVPRRSISASGPGAPTSVSATAYSTYRAFSVTSRPTATPVPPATPPSDHVLPVAQPRTRQQTVPRQTAPHRAVVQQVAPPREHAQSIGSRGIHDLPSLIRRHRHAVSLLMILFVVALVPAVRYLVRRA